MLPLREFYPVIKTRGDNIFYEGSGPVLIKFSEKKITTWVCFQNRNSEYKNIFQEEYILIKKMIS